MIFYLILMLFLMLMSCRNGQSKNKAIISGIVLFAIMGFKSSSIGNDTPSYLEFFNRLNRMSTLFDANTRFEKGYQLYNKLIGYFFKDSQALFIITALICVACIIYGISQYSINWQYSLFLFVGLRFYYFFLSGLRQSIAVSIIFVSYKFLKERKYIKYVALILLASTFHFSALIFIFAWPISRMKLNQSSIVKLVVGIGIVYIFFSPILNKVLSYLPIYYSHYTKTTAFEGNNLANYIGAVIPCTVLLLSYMVRYKSVTFVNRWRKNYYEDADSQNFFLIIAVGLSLIATRASILDRMVQYYWIFSIISIPNMLFSIKNERKRTGWYLGISTFVILYNAIILIFRPEWNAIVPYRFFWQN